MSNSANKPNAEEMNQKLQESYNKNLKTDTLVHENRELQAQINNAKLKIQKQGMDKISRIEDSIAAEDLSSRVFDKNKMLKDVEDRKNAVLFLTERLSEDFIAAPGSLIAIPSMTNNGKSTLTAHIAEAILNKNSKVLILSNEEKEEDVRARISCIRKGISFGDYKTGKCSPEQINIILDDAEFLSQDAKLVVISPKNDVDAYKVTTVKGVMSTLEKAKGKFDAVLIDYYTNVNVSEMGAVDPWHVNNQFATELNIFKDTAPFPIIVMAQCEGIRTDKKVEDKGTIDFESNHPMYRWKGGKNILIYATDIIELTRDFENSRSYLYAHKVRFGHGDLQRQHCLLFDKKMQRFVEWSPELDAKITASKVVRQTKDRSKEMGLESIFDERDN